jgi:ABC-type multidrug transport system fused ATPase/permease subunit
MDLLRATEPAPSPPVRDLPTRGELTAEAVTFGYAGDDVLHGVSVSIGAGERVALVGPTGAGKTTLAKLLSGLYHPAAGTVRYAGAPLPDLDPAQVRRLLALVPQRVHLVAGTLLDNLLLVPGEPDRDRVSAAVAALGLDTWVAGLPAGLDSDVGNRGDRLSTGEQQLIGLVRAALVDPAVLILDEATADIDPVTATRLETAIDRLCADRTLVVVAHRPETITRLDRAVRVVDGRVAGEPIVPDEGAARG